MKHWEPLLWPQSEEAEIPAFLSRMFLSSFTITKAGWFITWFDVTAHLWHTKTTATDLLKLERELSHPVRKTRQNMSKTSYAHWAETWSPRHLCLVFGFITLVVTWIRHDDFSTPSTDTKSCLAACSLRRSASGTAVLWRKYHQCLCNALWIIAKSAESPTRIPGICWSKT